MPYIKDSWGSGSLRQPKKEPSGGGSVVPKNPTSPPIRKAKAKKTRRIVNQPMDNA